MCFDGYDSEGYYDEMFGADGSPRLRSAMLVERIKALNDGELSRRQQAAERALLNMGITFNVYGHEAGTEKVWPFDVIPRIIEHSEWLFLERGLKQRIRALNLFIDDLYHDRKIVRDGVVPADLVESGKCYLRPCQGFDPPGGVWCHITGTDLVRDADGKFYVLEDNLRCPSGVSYVIENREVMKRTFPQVFQGLGVVAVEDYPERLLETLQFVAPKGVDDPTVVLLTPGPYNSAYFEHSFLAQQMGVELVEGRDLVVSDGYVHMKTTHGLKRVDVIYRRIDDDFLDPLAFRPDSALGVPGLAEVYRNGRVALANAPGTGIADDKAVYAYVPQIIKYYLGEDIILPNVPTFLCSDEKQRNHVLANMDKLVIKPTNESGGYGIVLGPKATPEERAAAADRIRENPRNFVAQPMLNLSRVPSLIDDHFEGRHVDLRPYILYGKDIFVLPGGLTRVALKKGSMVVNSSQGGGSKDTWVLGSDVVPVLRRRSDDVTRGEQRLGAKRPNSGWSGAAADANDVAAAARSRLTIPERGDEAPRLNSAEKDTPTLC
ncbi:MAG: circularly permuted type 2 ATP-grasp protein [Pirellulales bacterium]